MFSTGHLTWSLAVAGVAGLEGVAAGMFVAAGVLADWDYPLGRVMGLNHRYLLTHSPVTWLPLGAVGLVSPPAAWVFLGLMLHFALDLFDLGLRLNPLDRRTWGLGLLRVADDAPFGVYLATYFRTPFFAALEVLGALAAAVVWAPRLLG